MKEEEKTKLPNFRVYDETGGCVTEDIYAESLKDAVERGREWIAEPNWGSFQGTVGCAVGKIIRTPGGEIDEGATREAERVDCSAVIVAKEPPCPEGGGHDWQTHFGPRRSGHGATVSTDICVNCSMYRTVDEGATQSGNGRQMIRVTYSNADEKSLTWAREERREWSEDHAREFVSRHRDDEAPDDEDLELAFAAIFERRANDKDRADGLWKLLCDERDDEEFRNPR